MTFDLYYNKSMNILSRVAFTIFGVDVYYYGLIMSLSILACLIVAFLLAKPKKIETSEPFEIFLSIVPAGILCARLFSVIFEDGLTLADYFNFRTGGMSIIGAIIGGALGALIYKLIKKKSFLHIADIITSVLLLGQSLGRWGNYFNNEVYGMEITNPSLQFFPFGVQIGGTWYEALFFYESVLSLIGFIVILIVYLKTKKSGWATGIYLTYYGTVRLILEGRRQAAYILKWGSVPVSSLVSGIFIVIGVAILICLTIKTVKQKKELKSGREEIHS